jgi:hypothetical protein
MVRNAQQDNQRSNSRTAQKAPKNPIKPKSESFFAWVMGYHPDKVIILAERQRKLYCLGSDLQMSTESKVEELKREINR